MKIVELIPRPAEEGSYVTFGPAGDCLPAAFGAVVEHEERPLRLWVAATFDGVSRVRAESVTVERADGESVTPADMAALQTATVMHAAVHAALRPGPPPKDEDEWRAIARLYWIEYVSWGNPRQAVMDAFDLPRSTANNLLRRKIRQRYPLPGLHAGAAS